MAAAKAFAQKGVKTVRMDDIATGLSISKRTLYELFHDKEDLLLDVMKLHREEMQEYMTQVASKAEKCFGSPLEVFFKEVLRIFRIQTGNSLRILRNIPR